MGSPTLNGTVHLRQRITCPHCWSVFQPEDVLWIAEHEDLYGDPRLGMEKPQRFLPTRFDPAGNALDAHGFVCRELACPQCHLPLPRPFLALQPAFVSIMGSVSCGKSFFLAAMTWELRRLLPERFHLDFDDADPQTNLSLIEYEASAFLSEYPDKLTILRKLIDRTIRVDPGLYDVVHFGNQAVSYPRPFVFSIRHCPPAGAYVRSEDSNGLLLCLYDNSGENFQVGQDTTSEPATRHMVQACALLFLFDPLQDQRFLQFCRAEGKSIPDFQIGALSRQETILNEAAARVRQHLHLRDGERHDRPLVVVVTKSDAWSKLLPAHTADEPFLNSGRISSLDLTRIEKRSRQVRELLMRACSPLVTAAEGFARHVLYVPVSALGAAPAPLHDPDSGEEGPAIRPRDIRPNWVTVPVLYGLGLAMPGMIPQKRR